MRAGRARGLLLLAIVPLARGRLGPPATSPAAAAGTPGAPDLVDARGEIVERHVGPVAATFAELLRCLDAVGHPFRVDIAIRDPDVPVVSFVYYHDVNRLVRVDATVDHETETYLLASRTRHERVQPADG